MTNAREAVSGFHARLFPEEHVWESVYDDPGDRMTGGTYYAEWYRDFVFRKREQLGVGRFESGPVEGTASWNLVASAVERGKIQELESLIQRYEEEYMALEADATSDRLNSAYPEVRSLQDVVPYAYKSMSPEQNLALPLYSYASLRHEAEAKQSGMGSEEFDRTIRDAVWVPGVVQELRRRFPHLTEQDALDLCSWALDEWTEAYTG